MDGSKSRKSDISATRKRRSSILKSQRPPRTPFSEVEFNVATPPDAAKSRRVSFSRRNGVATDGPLGTNWAFRSHSSVDSASTRTYSEFSMFSSVDEVSLSSEGEFEITEATTAWKNVYEEHNKSMESSVNESDGKERRPGLRVGHLGGRRSGFEEQEVELVSAGPRDQLGASFSGDAAASAERGVSAPDPRDLDFTEFTEQQTNQLFGDDANPIILETTDHIQVDFSAIAPIGDDNFGEIEIEQQEREKTSYVDIDLNATHFSIKAEESMSDMSITDTVHSPKVAAAKSASEETKSKVSDWAADKENVAVNPYAAPAPADRFALCDDGDDVLVFDGKKCKFQSSHSNRSSSDTSTGDVSQVKPNITQKWKTIIYDDDEDISMTQAVRPQIIMPMQSAESRELADIVYDDEFRISMTQAVPSNIIQPSQPKTSSDKRTSLFFEELVDMTETQALPSNILGVKFNERRKTIVYDNDDGNISMTEDISAKIISEAEVRGENILSKDKMVGNTTTQAVGKDLGPKLDERRKTILYGADDGNISMTQAITAKIISETEARGITILYNDENGDISMTQAIPNLLGVKLDESRKSTVKKKDECHISMTEAISTKIISEAAVRGTTILYKSEDGDISMTQAVPVGALRIKTPDPERRKSYENDAADVSITRAVPSNIMWQVIKHKDEISEDVPNISTSQAPPTTEAPGKRRTILFSSDQGDVSITQALPANLIVPGPSVPDLGKTITADAGEVVLEIGSGSIDRAAHKAMPHVTKSKLNEDEHILFNVDSCNVKMSSTRKSTAYNASSTLPDMSMTQVIPLNNNLSTKNTSIEEDTLNNMSITKPIPTNLISIENEMDNHLKKYKRESLKDGNYNARFNQSVAEQDVLVFDAAIKLDKHNKEGSIHETVSVNSKTSCSSKSSDEQKPEKMDEDEEDSSPAESVIEVRSATSSKIYDGDKTGAKVDGSILNELLDMTNAAGAPGDCEGDDNRLVIKSSSEGSSEDVPRNNCLEEPKESFVLIKDSDEELGEQAPGKGESVRATESPVPENNESQRTAGVVGTIRHRLGELLGVINKRTSPEHRQLALAGPARESGREETNTTLGAKMDATQANDTKAILDLLSQYTDDPAEKDLSIKDSTASPTKFNGHLAIEHKVDVGEPQRLKVPNRMSMVRCREDMLKDISMAHAMKQYASEETADESQAEFREPPSPTTASSCNDVVKQLKFDDSMREASTQQPIMYTPLKKTAFGETAYMQDQDMDRAKVIPGYLTNLSEDLKQIMSALTKPMVNDAPFQRNKTVDESAQKSSSTCSTQIQANLLTSSQIDLEPDMLSCSPARSQLAPPRAARPPPRAPAWLDDEDYGARLIVFDHRNPLNNVLLPPIDAVVTHSYNPRVSDESLASCTAHSSAFEAEPEEGQRETESHAALHAAPVPGAVQLDTASAVSDLSAPASVDRAVGDMWAVRDSEANTVIAMKRNLELLEASSSLTLVDAAPAPPAPRGGDSDPGSPAHKDSAKAAFQVIYHIKEQDCELKMDSDVTSNDEDAEVEAKGKKRVYSPLRSDRSDRPLEEEVAVTPKPASKVLKVSTSPTSFKGVDWAAPTGQAQPEPAEAAASPPRSAPAAPDDDGPDGRKQPKEEPKSGHKSQTVVTIQQVLATYEPTMPTHMLAPLAESTSARAAAASLGSSRPNLHSDSEGLASEPARSATPSRPDWQPELIYEMSSKNLASECESGVNVVAKIDVLPFMGSADCEWEARGADAWSFRLLRARLRLVVRLEHRHENASRTRVRADTAVRAMLLEQLPLGRIENPIAALCVRFAAEAMRHLTSLGCARAGDVPALLRRCAGVARVAVRWGRAMHAARAQLAYSLTEDGALSLKVANIPMRSVWEVTMRMELVVSNAHETPWPRAGAVRVARVVSEWPVRAHELRRLLHTVPADWGHVPRAVWKIFKYLKNRTVDDDLMLGL